MLMYRDGSNLVEWYVDGVLFESKNDLVEWVSGPDGTWYVDDVSIQYSMAVPEPGSLVAFATFGIGMIGFAVRRKS